MGKHPKVHKQFSDPSTVGTLIESIMAAIDPASGTIDAHKAADHFFGKVKAHGQVPAGLRAATEQQIAAVAALLAGFQAFSEASIAVNAELHAADGK